MCLPIPIIQNIFLKQLTINCFSSSKADRVACFACKLVYGQGEKILPNQYQLWKGKDMCLHAFKEMKLSFIPIQTP